MILVKMKQDVWIWTLAWFSIYVSTTDVINVLRIGVLLVSLTYSAIRLWNYINKNR